MIKKFHSTLFYASDLTKTSEFYKQLGFSAELSEGTIRVELGNFKLAFVDENKTPIKNESGAKPKGLGVFTYVEVDNVDEYFKSLKEKGIHTSSEPRDWPWGKREFAVKDPDGYKLIFFTNLKE
jgi:catechol 2,3-dioxygenase-like lactoylglutathione lyase family enzyme